MSDTPLSVDAAKDALPAALRAHANIEQMEVAMLEEEQVECPVIHRFGPGIYIREVMMPAGILAIGHRQKYAQLNVFLKGRVSVVTDDGRTVELVAPMTFTGPPGRKIGYVHEDVVWQNIYATEETDIEKLEAMFLEKSDPWQEAAARQSIARLALPAPVHADREDFAAALAEFGYDAATVRQQSEHLGDQMPFPLGSYKCMVGDSSIEGRGLIATGSIAAGEVIAPARIGGMRTPAGRYTNHARDPNAVMVMRPNGDIDLVALRPITGLRGGLPGEEITIDYRAALRWKQKGE